MSIPVPPKDSRPTPMPFSGNQQPSPPVIVPAKKPPFESRVDKPTTIGAVAPPPIPPVIKKWGASIVGAAIGTTAVSKIDAMRARSTISQFHVTSLATAHPLANSMNVGVAVLGQSLTFPLRDATRDYFPSGILGNILGSGLCGSSVLVVLNPFRVVNTRMYMTADPVSQVIRTLYQERGVRGFYAGILPASACRFVFAASAFPIADALNKSLTPSSPHPLLTDSVSYFIAGGDWGCFIRAF